MTQKKEKWFINRLIDVLKHKRLSLTTPVRTVLLALGAHANAEGKADVSRDEIAFFTGMIKNNVSRYLKVLTNHKIITTKKQYEEGTKCMKNSIYQINIKAIIELSVDNEGNPYIKGSHHIDATIDPLMPKENTEMKDEGRINMMLGSHQYDAVKLTSNLKAKEKKEEHLKDIVQCTAIEQNIHRLKQRSCFEDFWAVYPRKQNKLQAQIVWERKRLDMMADQLIEDILLRTTHDVQWLGKAKEFLPLATTYLNGERWNDEIITAELEAQKGNGKFDPGKWLIDEVKKDYENKRRNQETVFDVSNFLSK